MPQNPGERLELARRLAGLTGRRKVDALLDSADPKALIRSLPAEDLFFTIQEVGLEEAAELVQLASPSQFRAFTDLDCWRRDAFHPRALLPWLRAADDDQDGLDRKLAALDLELVELLLRDGVDIWDLEEDPDREPEGTPWRSPEGRYVVDFKLEGEEGQVLRRVVESYYQRDPLEAIRFLEAVRWELPSELEEIALRFRNARLGDLGFPELEQALKLYAYSDPDQALDGESPRAMEPPGFFLEALGSQSFLDQAMGTLTPENLAGLDRELVGLLNGALVADAVDPSDLEAVRRSLAAARAHLSLGLEYAARGDVTRGPELLNTAPLARIFQVASGLVLRRKFRADRIQATRLASFPSTPSHCWFDPPLGRAMESLRRKRPRFDAALDAEGGAVRAFQSRRDLEIVDAALARAEALVSRLGKLGVDSAAAEALARAARPEAYAEVTLGELLLHSVLAARLPGHDARQPFSFTELPALLGSVLTPDHRLVPDLGPALRAHLEQGELTGAESEVSRELADYLLERIARELPALAQPGIQAPQVAASALLVTVG